LSIATLKAMMPPKAEVGSVLKALRRPPALAPTATPQGLACLTMTQAAGAIDASKALTHSQAASASAMLL
jgi:hypothetical protein